MQFLLTAYDGKDQSALARRMAARDAHMEKARDLHREGKLLHAAAILDNEQNMIGSILIVEFSSRKQLQEEWLAEEPYVLGNVWQDITIQPCKVPAWIQP